MKRFVRGDAGGFRQYHTTFHILTLDTTQQNTGIVASVRQLEFLVEHLDTRDDGLHALFAQADDLDFFVLLQRTALDTARHHRTTTLRW